MIDRDEAAKARRRATLRNADRPAQRRCAEFAGSQPRVQARAVMTIRDSSGAGGGLDFSGYASVTDSGYEMYDMFGPYTELVASGSFDKTLAQPDLDVPLVLNHDSLRRMARTTNGTLQLSADDTGLLSSAPNLDPADADVAYIAPKLNSGLIDEMSFRFMITSGEWSPDWSQFNINEVDLNRGDVSIVGYGANPATTAQLRSITSKLRTGQVLDAGELNVLTDSLRANHADLEQDDFSSCSPDVLREHEQLIRRELRRRGLTPAMTREEAFAI